MAMMTDALDTLFAAAGPLWDPRAHEPLAGDLAWTEDRTHAAVEEIVERTLDAFVPGRFWPRHVGDDYGQGDRADLGLWTGAAGILWGLRRLGADPPGAADLEDAIARDTEVRAHRGLMSGETGLRLVSWRIEPTPERRDRLLDLVRASRAEPSDELFDGLPGTMLAAWQVHRLSGSAPAAALWSECAEQMLSRFDHDPELDCRIWSQRRRGRMIRSIGAGHGFASNAASLLAGRDLLESEVVSRLERDVTRTAVRLAVHADGLANWPTSADPDAAARFPTRVQWCHGAPGLITSLSHLPADPELEAALTAAGELIWRAGPLRKGAGLCHGTAGNALALLALHARTGEERWRMRARRFALHALTQVDPSRPRHSLWTGDLGVALTLAQCAGEYEGLPVLGVL